MNREKEKGGEREGKKRRAKKESVEKEKRMKRKIQSEALVRGIGLHSTRN